MSAYAASNLKSCPSRYPTRGAPGGARRFAAALLIGLLCAACSTPNPPANAPLSARPATGSDYSFGEWIKTQPRRLDERLVVLSFSGGGVRASTVATGVLRKLEENKLGDRVALISSTSGGSVTAAVFAADGFAGITRLESDFLGENNMAALVPRLVPALVLPGANRAMAFSEFINERLMSPSKTTTYADLIRRWPAAPFVVLNATDMSTGGTFDFTQQSFSYLCSDLAQFQLSHAVAASANFPFALNPLPLRNYWDGADCPNYVSYDADQGLVNAQRDMYLYPEMLERARYVHALRHTYNKDARIQPEREIRNLHLLDGGLSDNLAARAVLRELSRNLKELEARGVRKILVVQVNAKAGGGKAYDNSDGIPSMLDVFWSVTANPIDVVTELSAYVSRMYLVELVRASNLDKDRQDKINIYPVYVDFNLASDSDRELVNRIGTSWSLPELDAKPSTVTFLKELGGNLMSEHPCFRHFIGKGSVTDDCQFMQLVADTGGIPFAPGAPPPPAPAPAPAPAPTIEKISLAADVFFAHGQATVSAPGIAALDELFARLEGMSVEAMIIVGHTDSTGGDAANQGLAERRAEAVKAFFVSKGLDPQRIYAEGKGESQPVADNSSNEGRAKNRRVEIEILGMRRVEY